MLRTKATTHYTKANVHKSPKKHTQQLKSRSFASFKKVGNITPPPAPKSTPKPKPQAEFVVTKTKNPEETQKTSQKLEESAQIEEENTSITTTHVPLSIDMDPTRVAKTGVLMLNMGGPSDPKDTQSFLTNLFSDPMIINMGRFQSLGVRAGKNRTPKVQKQYETIGGSPIGRWTDEQGKEFTKVLDIISPTTAPHKHYIGFRYAEPSTQVALEQMKKDGVKNIIAFSQYPMYSCTTTGSSLNDLWERAKAMDMGPENGYSWSVIDRWHDNPLFHDAIAYNIKEKIDEIVEDHGASALKDTIVLFSAHSVPLKTMNKGDQYPAEISHTVEQTMVALNKIRLSNDQKQFKLPHILCWQSKVGFLPWLRPSTHETIEKIPSLGYKKAIIVPIAFTSDHIETLHEIDIEYKDLAQKSGIELIRAASLNTSMHLIKAQADIVKNHIDSNVIVSSHQYRIKCLDCVQPEICRQVLGYNEDELFQNERKQ